MYTERRKRTNDDTAINNYNTQCDEAFGKAIRGEISMYEYKVEKRQIDKSFSTLFAEH